MSAFLDAAIDIARQAGALLLERFSQTRTVGFKGPARTDLVTDADTASEALILSQLRARFPTHAVLAEESGASGVGSFTWFVDPLDGTTNYAHGVPHFCVTLALEGPVGEGVGLLAGVVYDPMRDECFSAARGEGAFLDGHRLTAGGPSALADAVVCTGFPYDVHDGPDSTLALFTHVVRRARGVRRMGSAALELAWLAAGRFDAFFELGLRPWDIAAGALLVAEAGGVATRIDGAAFDPRCRDILAAGPGLADALTHECRALLATTGWRPSGPTP